MLSRTADHLYWMARYTERAENTVRMLDVCYRMSLLPGTNGLDALQHFLESGFDAFAALGDASAFLRTIAEREGGWIDCLFDAPLAEERISYGMPALFQNGAVVYFGAFKNHLGLFPPVEDPALLAQVAPYAGPKGNLQFPYSQPMPLSLITAIVQARVRANADKSAAKLGRSVAAPAKRAARRAVAHA